ncbi:MAG: dienelactone hydrolase family protein [Xanthobacteraceae bacterium]
MALERLFCALAAVALWVTACGAAERVDLREGSLTLHALLYRPAGAGPFPAVVALHGCGGLGPAGAVNWRYGAWAKLLTAKGFIVLFPDSYSSRGVGSKCRSHQKVRASRERVADANAARHWLQTQPSVRADHISLLGWSSGAIAALWAVRPNAEPREDGADFRSAVAFYPGCRRLRQTAWSARIPTLILVGGADERAPASLCQQMVAGARGRSARAEIVVYPGAGHEFDRVNAELVLSTELPRRTPSPAKAGRRSNPRARADALTRVPEWLAR